MGLGGAEDFRVLHGLELHVLHHGLHIQAHLNLTASVLCGSLGGSFCHHGIPPGNGGNLQAHVGLVDGADILKLLAQSPDDVGDIFLKVLHHGFGFPAALADDPDRAGEVEQGHDGFNAVFPAAADHLPIVLNLLIVEYAVLGLDSRPLNGEAIGIQTGFPHQPDIFGIAVVVVAGNAAFFLIGGMGHLLLGPAVGVGVVALHLMGSGGGADEKAFREFAHNESLLCNYLILEL